MFVGHYAPAFVLKRVAPAVPLWQLFLGVQALDFLFWGLVPLGAEKVWVDPDAAGFLALRLSWMPWSHSVAAALLWGGLAAALVRGRHGLILGVAVVSHWGMDWLVHGPDLPLLHGEGPLVGLGLWRWPLAGWGAEVLGLLAAAALVGRRAVVLAVVLGVIQSLQVFVLPLPTQVPLLAALSLLSFSAFAVAAWAAER